MSNIDPAVGNLVASSVEVSSRFGILVGSIDTLNDIFTYSMALDVTSELYKNCQERINLINADLNDLINAISEVNKPLFTFDEPTISDLKQGVAGLKRKFGMTVEEECLDDMRQIH